MKNAKTCLLPIGIFAALLCVLLFFSGAIQSVLLPISGMALGVVILLLVICRGVELNWARERQKQMDDVFSENASLRTELIDRVAIPCALIESSGKIVWRNEMLKKLYEDADIRLIQPNFDFSAPLVAAPMELSGSVYQVMSIPAHREKDDRELVFQYWVDRTEAAHYQRLFEEQ
ncbi:MAG TPA: hypothetical protein PLR57_05720, partial [Clostridia bacterium]|nr:hypothetical protein [Clostridia bacterium]